MKIKYKYKGKKSKKLFLSVPFITTVLILLILCISASYAAYSKRLTISGTITGTYTPPVEEPPYTYYFEKPDYWNEPVYAHIWPSGSTGTEWPGLEMEYVSTQSNGNKIYKVEVTSDLPFYSNHSRIIFNDYGSNQTVNLTIDKEINNNQIYMHQPAYRRSSTEQFLSINKFTSGDLVFTGSDVYAYVWKDSGGTITQLASWPGIKITGNLLDATYGIYYIKVDATIGYNYIIFHDGNGHQTKDLSIPSTTRDYRWRYNSNSKATYRFEQNNNSRLEFAYGWYDYTE